LQRCNTADAALDHPVVDLHEAVTRMGLNAIYRLVAVVIGEGMLGSEQAGYGISSGGLWEHSVTTAVAARVIAKKLGNNDDLAFTVGLLHDIGKLVLSKFLEGSQHDIEVKTESDGLSFLEAEKSILGVEHSEIGGRILQRWNFPENFVKAVWYHHDPAGANPYQALAACVHLGDIIAHNMGHAQGFESFAIVPRAEALEILEVTPTDIDMFLMDTTLALEQLNIFTPAKV